MSATTLNNDSMKNYMEYSDEPEKLTGLLKELEVSYVSQGMRKYFPDDTDKREVIEVTVKRGERSISFDYGLSLVDSEGLNMPKNMPHSGESDRTFISMAGLPKSLTRLFITKSGKALAGRYKGMEGTFHSFQGNWTEYSKVKELRRKEALKGLLYSILCSLRSDYYCPTIFEDFCGEFGYDEDSRKAHDTWQACLKMSQKVQNILFEDEVNYLPA